MNANVRKLAVKKFLLTSVAALFLATGAAHAEYETMQGIDWKCPGGVIVRFDHNGGKYEKGSTETVVITALQERRLTRWHLVWIIKRGVGFPILNGKLCKPECDPKTAQLDILQCQRVIHPK
jgi:hypothetical protein